MRLIASILSVVITLSATAALAVAQDNGANSPERKQLQAKFESRYPQLREMKAQGKVGETSDGFIDAVKDADDAARKLIDEENRDRKTLYSMIAKDEGIDEDVVARRAAKRHFDRAKKGEYLKDNGTWRQK